jgi:hypothetical protein
VGWFRSTRYPASRVPDGFAYRPPWRAADTPLEEQLRREVPRGHVLYGLSARAVARRQDNDDVLFELFGADLLAGFALVHLDWRSRPGRFTEWPHTVPFPTFDDWVRGCMNPDAEEWE